MTADVEDLYPPGSFFLTTIGGRTGWWVALAQTLVGIPSRWTHAGIIGHQGITFEAAPGGVRLGDVTSLASKPHVVCDAPIQLSMRGVLLPAVLGARESYERTLRDAVVFNASQLLGTPYSFLDYLALGLHHLAPRSRLTRWVRWRVADTEHLICSAFVDEVFERSGIHLYDDDRLAGDVTPSDLDGWAQEHGHIVTRTGGL